MPTHLKNSSHSQDTVVSLYLQNQPTVDPDTPTPANQRDQSHLMDPLRSEGHLPPERGHMASTKTKKSFLCWALAERPGQYLGSKVAANKTLQIGKTLHSALQGTDNGTLSLW